MSIEDEVNKIKGLSLDAKAGPLDCKEETDGVNKGQILKQEQVLPIVQMQLPQQATVDGQPFEAESTVTVSAGGQGALVEDSETNLIINYLPPNMNEGQLAILFSPYGALENCKIVVDLHTGRSRGYGFVKYDNAKSAVQAMKAINGYNVGGKKLKVAFSRPQCKEIQNANLYITNIPLTYDEEKLKTYFLQFGRIVECRILKDTSGKSRGVGFVRMDTHHHAIDALNKRNHFLVEPGLPPINVKLAQRRSPRKWTARDLRGPPMQMGAPRGAGPPMMHMHQHHQHQHPHHQHQHQPHPHPHAQSRHGGYFNQSRGYYRQKHSRYGGGMQPRSMPQMQMNNGGGASFYPIYDPYHHQQQQF